MLLSFSPSTVSRVTKIVGGWPGTLTIYSMAKGTGMGKAGRRVADESSFDKNLMEGRGDDAGKEEGVLNE